KKNLHDSNKQENLDNLIAIQRQRVVFVHNQTGYHRTDNGSEQRKETIETSSQSPLIRWHIVGDDRTPWRVSEIIGELEQQEEERKHEEEDARGKIGCEGKGSQHDYIKNSTNNHKGTA